MRAQWDVLQNHRPKVNSTKCQLHFGHALKRPSPLVAFHTSRDSSCRSWETLELALAQLTEVDSGAPSDSVIL